MSFGGLKDRHAVTVQHVTIHGGPKRNLSQTNLELTYLGQCREPFTSKDIAANRFAIVLRDLSEADTGRLECNLQAVGRDGMPNYFDEQRFGSLGQSGEFVARAWCAGDYERALWLVMADAHPHDRTHERRQRRLIREHWGDWARVKAESRRSPWDKVLAHLAARPYDYRGALAQVRPDLRSIYVAAFQSFLWNQLLAAWLCRQVAPDCLWELPVAGGLFPFHHDAGAAFREGAAAAQLPLPSARIRGREGPYKEVIDEVLQRYGMTLADLRIKYPRDSFFSKGDRAAVAFPKGLESRLDADELTPGRSKMTLRFDLPRGSYATMLTRRIGAGMQKKPGGPGLESGDGRRPSG